MQRITPDQIKSAFNATGLLPIQGRSWDNDSQGNLAYGCGLFALALRDQSGTAAPDVILPSLVHAYTSGFMDGWDGYQPSTDFMVGSRADYDHGHQDGQAAYHAMTPA